MSQPKIASQAEVDAKLEVIYAPLFSLTLPNGRVLKTKDFHTTMTFGRVLGGWPIAAATQGHFDDMPGRYQPIFGKFPVHVILPRIEKMEVKNPFGQETPWSSKESMPLEFLPKIEIAAFFYSFPPVKNQEMHASGLIVVWHQDEREIIPCPESKAKLLELDWNALAQDFEF
jgi:hypothetical protein